MNLKQLSVLLVILAVIGGAGLYLYKRSAESWRASDSSTGQKLFADLPINDIAQITIKQGESELTLAKKDDLWSVQERFGYAANFSQISEFLRKVWELKGVQKVKVGASQLGRIELGAPDKSTNSSTLVEFKDKNSKLIQSLLLGKKHMRQSAEDSPYGPGDGWPDGRYIKVSSSKPEPNVWLISEPFSNIESKPAQWLSKDFVKVENIRSVSVTKPEAANNWTLARETESGEMKLADKTEVEELDSSKIYGVANALSYANFADVLGPDATPEQTGLDNPITATIETFDNFAYTVNIGKETNDNNYPVRIAVKADLPKERPAEKDEKPEDKARLDQEFKDKIEKLNEKLDKEKALEKWTFLVSKWTIDPFLKNRADILAEPKKAEPKEDEPGIEEPAKQDNGDAAAVDAAPEPAKAMDVEPAEQEPKAANQNKPPAPMPPVPPAPDSN